MTGKPKHQSRCERSEPNKQRLPVSCTVSEYSEVICGQQINLNFSVFLFLINITIDLFSIFFSVLLSFCCDILLTLGTSLDKSRKVTVTHDLFFAISNNAQQKNAETSTYKKANNLNAVDRVRGRAMVSFFRLNLGQKACYTNACQFALSRGKHKRMKQELRLASLKS